MRFMCIYVCIGIQIYVLMTSYKQWVSTKLVCWNYGLLTVLNEYKVKFHNGTSDFIAPSDIANVVVMLLD